MTNVFVSFWFTCLRVLFTFLHIVCNALQYFDATWTLFKRKLEVYSMANVGSDLYVSRFVTGLGCPSHLAIIVGDGGTLQCQDLTNLIIWCLAAGVTFLTVYDQKGVILEKETKFFKHFMENARTKEKKVVFSNLKGHSNGTSNGVTQKLHVLVLSGVGSKSTFVDTIRYFGREKSTGDKYGCVDPDSISDQLLSRSGFPEPELAIVASPHMSTFGFPPWDVRLTEFVRINSISGINAKEFCGILKRYLKCEKRVGK